MLIPLIFRGIRIQFIDADGSVFFDVKTFSAIVADLVRIEIADLAFQTAVAFLFFIQDAHFPFHGVKYTPSYEKKQAFPQNNQNFFRTNVCKIAKSML